MKSVNKAVRKKDAMELLLGKPVYTDDIAPKDCLVVKLLITLPQSPCSDILSAALIDFPPGAPHTSTIVSPAFGAV